VYMISLDRPNSQYHTYVIFRWTVAHSDVICCNDWVSAAYLGVPAPGGRAQGFISWRLHDDVARRMRGEARSGTISTQGLEYETSAQSPCYA
jgi:hypothetical protein